jgi:hypothetical protein
MIDLNWFDAVVLLVALLGLVVLVPLLRRRKARRQ